MVFIRRKKKKEPEKPEYSNDALEDLADLLDKDPEPIVNMDFFADVDLDYSLESLEHLERYFDTLDVDELEDEEFSRIVFRAAAYLGEVIRRNARIEYNWVDYHEAKRVGIKLADDELSLATVAVLVNSNGCTAYPFGKVIKRLVNGKEDDVHFFAQYIVSIS